MAKDKKIDMVILGLLSHEDLTGYDIKKRIDGAVSFFWKGSFGNIYPALKDMESMGLIGKKDTSVGGRERVSYHILEKGKEQLVKWLREEQAGNELRYETLLKLFFGGVQGKDISIRNIELFEDQIRSNLTLLKGYADTLEKNLDNNDHVYYYLTVSFGIDTYEAYLKWCVKAKKMLKEKIKEGEIL
ncbi:MAG: PadR family transcriptional regulator [Lachnospiraceae bacterium]|nr:PadR family transcriptional regulator [Lachnospiraceae bacterium]